MKWISKETNNGLNLDLICYWEYRAIPEEPKYNYMNVYFTNYQRTYYGIEADEIYILLIEEIQKEKREIL